MSDPWNEWKANWWFLTGPVNTHTSSRRQIKHAGIQLSVTLTLRRKSELHFTFSFLPLATCHFTLLFSSNEKHHIFVCYLSFRHSFNFVLQTNTFIHVKGNSATKSCYHFFSYISFICSFRSSFHNIYLWTEFKRNNYWKYSFENFRSWTVINSW